MLTKIINSVASGIRGMAPLKMWVIKKLIGFVVSVVKGKKQQCSEYSVKTVTKTAVKNGNVYNITNNYYYGSEEKKSADVVTNKTETK